jgi:hypothetical protein
MSSLQRTFEIITTPRLKDNNMAYRDITQPILEGSNETIQNFEFDLDVVIEHIARLANNSLLPLYPLNEPAVHKLLAETPDHVIEQNPKALLARRPVLLTMA